jgi:hypothetical protein
VEDLFTVGIVPGPLLWVREDLVRGLKLGKAARGILGVVNIFIRMQFQGFSPVRLLDAAE